METEELDKQLLDGYNNSIVESYGTDEYETSEQVKTALKSIKEIESKDAGTTINAVYNIINSGYTRDNANEKDIALLAHNILRKTLKDFPQEEFASKALELCKNICSSNPDLADSAIDTMGKIFNKFSANEKVQRKCLSTLESLNRNTFDDDTKAVLDDKKKMMEGVIKAQELMIKRGQYDKVAWKKTNQQSTRANESNNTNSDSRQDDKSSSKGKSAADDIIGKTGRNWETEREKSFNERINRITREIENGTYGKDFGKKIDNDYGYRR